MIKGEKGQVLPIALFVMAIGTLAIAPFLGHASSSLISSHTYGQAITEQYSADAGIEYAIWHLQNGETQVPAFTLNGQTVSVTVTDQGEQVYRITSTATSDGGSSTTIESYVLADTSGDYTTFPGGFTLDEGEEYDGDIYAEGNIQLDEGAVINGDVYAEGNVQLAESATINGNVYAEGDVQLDENATITGDVIAEGNIQLYEGAIITGDVCGMEDVQLGEDATIDGDVYAGGNVQLGEGAVITGDIYPYNECPVCMGDTSIDIQSWQTTRQ